MKEANLKLKEGVIYRGVDLAAWFGISAQSFYVGKQKKLEELKKYCEWEMRGKGYYITKVFKDTYEGSAKARKLKKVEGKFDEVWSGNVSETAGAVQKGFLEMGIGRERDHLNDRREIINDAYELTKEVKERKWGIPFFTEGCEGSCEYAFAVETLNDRAKVSREISKHFGNITERFILVLVSLLENAEAFSRDEAIDMLLKGLKIDKADLFLFLEDLGADLGVEYIIKTNVYSRTNEDVEDDEDISEYVAEEAEEASSSTEGKQNEDILAEELVSSARNEIKDELDELNNEYDKFF